MLLLRSLFSLEDSIHFVKEDRMATAEQLFQWLAILWERGFCHDNPQGTIFCHKSADILILMLCCVTSVLLYICLLLLLKY